MTTSTGAHRGLLGWVHGEIDRGLNVVAGQLAESPDPAKVAPLAEELHRITGALGMAELHGAVRYCELLETLAASLKSDQLAAAKRQEAADALREGIPALGAYLRELVAGGPDRPLRLLPAYTALRRALGEDKDAAADLFHPDIRTPRPAHSLPPAPHAPLDPAEVTRAARGHYQRAMLQWLRGDARGLQQMKIAMESMDRLYGTVTPLFWAGTGLIEGIGDGGITADAQIRRLCARIDIQISRMAEGSTSVAEALLREVLYHIACCTSEGLTVAAVREHYALASYLRESQAGGVSPLATAIIEQIKAAWETGVATGSPDCAAIAELVDRLSAALAAGAGPALQALREVTTTLTAMPSATLPEAVGLTVAKLLLIVEELAGPAGAQHAGLDARLRWAIANVRATLAGGVASEYAAQPEVPDTTLSRETLVLVCEEVIGGLKRVEHALTNFIGQTSQVTEAQSAIATLGQICGALQVAQLEDAANVTRRCRELVSAWIEGAGEKIGGHLEIVADALAAMELYMHAVKGRQSSAGGILDPILPRLGLDRAHPSQVETPLAPAAPTVESGLSHEHRQRQDICNEWREFHEGELDKLQREPPSVHEDARLVSDPRIEQHSAAALAVASRSDAEPITAPAGTIIAIGQDGEPTAADAMRIDAGNDPEILEVFLEEATEVLQAIAATLGVLRGNPEDREAFASVRRAFHTLKGSSRVAGLSRVGDVAWKFEELLNGWQGENRPVSAALVALLAAGGRRFEDWIDALKTAGRATVVAEDLLSGVERMRTGEATPKCGTAPRATAPVSTAQGADATTPPEPQPPAATPDRQSQPRHQPVRETVTLGDALTVSRTLFEIFLQEAAVHLRTLREELAEHGAEKAVPHELVRAAHTLAGTARTVGVGSLAELSHALEKLLQMRHESALPMSVPERRLAGSTLGRLETMVESVRGRRLPAPETELMQQLEAAREQPPSAVDFPPLPDAATAPPSIDEATAIPTVDAADPQPEAPAGTAEQGGAPAAPEEPAAQPAVAGTTASAGSASTGRGVIAPVDMAAIDTDLRGTFADEGLELATALARGMQAWRNAPENAAHAEEIARHLHTLKGSARSAGAMSIGEMVHGTESRVLDAMHAKEASPGLLDGLQAIFDQWCEAFENARHVTHSSLTAAVANSVSIAAHAEELKADVARSGSAAQLRVQVDTLERLLDGSAEIALTRTRISAGLSSARRAAADMEERVTHLRAQLREIEIQAESQMRARFDGLDQSDAAFDPLEFDRYTRLQELTRFMAESLHDLTTVQYNLSRHFDEAEGVLGQQARLQRNLHSDLMRIRTVPFASAAERLQRIARQTASELGRSVRLNMSGGHVEVDRTVLDRLIPPLEHMVRNAVAHGIEDAAERRRGGKPETGNITIAVHQEANNVMIVCSDDGAGLDLRRIRAKAEAGAVIAAGEPASDQTLRQLIFRPGFSTSEQLTEVAGRGVGMDVVKSTVLALGGDIRLDSQPGIGTTFTLSVPLTLAVVQAIMIRNADRLYGIPSNLVAQIHRCDAAELEGMYEHRRADWGGERHAFRYMGDLLGTAPRGTVQRRNNIVIFLRAASERVAVHVDDILLNQELALKEMGPQLAGALGVSGASIGENGRALLIINPLQIAMRHSTTSVRAQIADGRPARAPLVLVVDDSVTVRKVTTRLLERSGYRVTTAKDGVEALERMSEELPAVVLLDIEMPRMDGFELTRHLRADGRTEKLPIIMISSRTAEKHRMHARDLGVTMFLGKPFNDAHLLRQMERLTRNGHPSARSVA
ncbi:MAG: Sensor histidine kinase RcsC [Gammaproteobacteria bacterium]|nr:Sensor histidine kinase RcsC [Gammaproteobacteria bacterium]